MEMNRPAAAAAALAAMAMLFVASCWNPFQPPTDDGDDAQYYDPADSAWKVLKNLEYAYVSLDPGHYTDCFRSDFEFHLLEVDWDDYDGDGLIDQYWGQDIEEDFHQQMFASVTAIELTLSGTQESPWSGDSTGEALQLSRTFDLKVYTDGAHTTGYRASGNALFICRPDSMGEWYVWQWYDNSDT
jgi:hypothetical protein